jgi:hypothetical protein
VVVVDMTEKAVLIQPMVAVAVLVDIEPQQVLQFLQEFQLL